MPAIESSQPAMSGAWAFICRDEALLAEVNSLVAAGKVFDPQRYDADWGLRRRLDVELTEKNQIRKFARYYPEPTDTSF